MNYKNAWQRLIDIIEVIQESEIDNDELESLILSIKYMDSEINHSKQDFVHF